MKLTYDPALHLWVFNPRKMFTQKLDNCSGLNSVKMHVQIETQNMTLFRIRVVKDKIKIEVILD